MPRDLAEQLRENIMAASGHTPPRTTAGPLRLNGVFDADTAALRAHLARHQERVDALPARPDRGPEQQAAAERHLTAGRTARMAFMRVHGERLHRELTDDGRQSARIEQLAPLAAELVPGLAPGPERLAAERANSQSGKDGYEVDQGILLWGMLRSPVAGGRILDAMLAPTARALAALPAFRRTGVLDLGTVHLAREGGAAHLTVTNTRYLNAEDDTLAEDLETAVDLALMDEQVHVGVVRGGVMDHPRYAGRRVFSSGINLTKLYHGRISFVDFLIRRELSYIHKLIRGIRWPEGAEPLSADGVVEKPWIAAVDGHAIGGGMQLLLAFDRVIADTGVHFSLPALQEGIVPGAANLRLGRIIGPRPARQVVLGGRRIEADDPAARLICDDIVAPELMDKTVAGAVEALDDPCVVPNRRMINLVEEPVDQFRAYMAEFALEQAKRLYSRDVLANIERTWLSRKRRAVD
jgi:thioesterase DpgC